MKGSRGRGRPPLCPPDVLARVVSMRREGKRLADICAELNAEGVPTPAGRNTWTTAHVSRLLYTRAAERMRAELGQACEL
jgi:Recombinase